MSDKHRKVSDPHVSVETMRTDYTRSELSEQDAARDPIVQLETWLTEAIASNVREPHAMSLATVGADGMPAARIVLLRGFDARGLVFYTNYESDKARDLAANPKASLLFFWPKLERQIRVQGIVEKVDAAQSSAYFHSRPHDSQIGAWASPQSREIASRDELDAAFARELARFADAQQVPLPPFWGGYRVRPERIEFWQGRANRLHDRLRYQRHGDAWTLHRLAP